MKFKRDKAVPETYSVGFQDRPSHSLALESLEWFEREGIPRERWTTAGLVGLFIRGYQDRFKRKLATLGSAFFVEVVVNLATLVTRVGMKDAVDAVEAVFGSDLKWVTSSHHKFLLNEANYAKYVVPAMARTEEAKKPAGEQAEFRVDGGFSRDINEVEEIEFLDATKTAKRRQVPGTCPVQAGQYLPLHRWYSLRRCLPHGRGVRERRLWVG